MKKEAIKRVEKEFNIPFDGLPAFVFLDLKTPLLNKAKTAYHDSPATTWTRCVMEQVWLCLLQGGQAISAITWFANENWPAGFQEGYDNIQRLDEHIDIMIWLAENMPTKTPIIVAVVTDDLNDTAIESALKGNSNIVTYHQVSYQPTLHLATEKNPYSGMQVGCEAKMDSIFRGIPSSYYEIRKPHPGIQPRFNETKEVPRLET